MVLFLKVTSMETEPQPGTELVPLNPIRVETALSRYPVHRLARKGNIEIEVREGTPRGESAVNWKVDLQQRIRPAGPAGLQARHAHHQPPDRGSPPPDPQAPQARQPQRHLPRAWNLAEAARTAADIKKCPVSERLCRHHGEDSLPAGATARRERWKRVSPATASSSPARSCPTAGRPMASISFSMTCSCKSSTGR